MSRDNMTILTWWAKSPLGSVLCSYKGSRHLWICVLRERKEWSNGPKMVPCVGNILLWGRTQLHLNYYMIHEIYWYNLPKNQWGTFSPILMLTPILKLLSPKCQRRFSPGNDRSISFCNRAVGFQWKKPPLLSWCLSGHHIYLKLYLQLSTLAPTYSIYLWKKSWNIFSKGYLLGGAVSFFACVTRQRFDLNEKTN